VGYAFINFIEPTSIIPFAKSRVGTKWFPPTYLPSLNHLRSRFDEVRNRFHSDKICDISYANIQGKESLIEKFRNSCVMDEDPTYRPKIFHSSGPLKGQEQEFPFPFPPTTSHPLLPPPLPNLWFWYLTGRFPEPNNTRRKLRSIACARQIGFPPFFQDTIYVRTFPSRRNEKDGDLNFTRTLTFSTILHSFCFCFFLPFL
jgi:hypothetical protein